MNQSRSCSREGLSVAINAISMLSILNTYFSIRRPFFCLGWDFFHNFLDVYLFIFSLIVYLVSSKKIKKKLVYNRKQPT